MAPLPYPHCLLSITLWMRGYDRDAIASYALWVRGYGRDAIPSYLYFLIYPSARSSPNSFALLKHSIASFLRFNCTSARPFIM
mgnify:CR=1 FL=1